VAVVVGELAPLAEEEEGDDVQVRGLEVEEAEGRGEEDDGSRKGDDGEMAESVKSTVLTDFDIKECRAASIVGESLAIYIANLIWCSLCKNVDFAVEDIRLRNLQMLSLHFFILKPRGSGPTR